MPRKKPQQLDPVEQSNSLPPAIIGHNAEVSDDALIAENFKLEDLIKQAQAKLDEWAKPHKARVAEIEAEISRRLLSRQSDSTKTDRGTAYFSDIMSTKIESVETLFDFIADNWDSLGADVKINIPIGTVRTYMDGHDGNLPPGMSNYLFTELNIRRS